MSNPFTGRYAVTLEVEVAREIGAVILADFERYFDKNNIDSKDTQNSDVELYWNLVRLYDKLFVCETLDEVKEIRAAFSNAHEHIKEIRGKS